MYVIAADAIYVVVGLTALALLFGFCVAILVAQQLVTIVSNRVLAVIDGNRESKRKPAAVPAPL
jgi:hypothetical protein